MRILADNLIPLLQYFFADQAEILALPFQEINREAVANSDILLTRSQLKIDAELLENSALKFIGSCVTGTDHLDIPYLHQQHIPWYAAEGCNSQSVIEYVLSLIAACQADELLALEGLSIGIIGVGRIGSRLNTIFKQLGWTVLLHDPIRAMNEPDFLHSALEDLTDCDVISLHTPLTRSGPYPSYHLIAKTFLESVKPDAVLINTARGAVIDSKDLLEFGQHLIWCLDVFENEPGIDLNIMECAYIATPHIAGHSVQAKQRGTELVYNAAAKQFNWPAKSMPITRKSVDIDLDSLVWQELMLALMDPRTENQRMKQAMLSCSAATRGSVFSQLRRTYPERFELDYLEFK
ncbi:MAG: 4-phosphoerythronate dehydrogenase [Gammaproteobacteria bacterium]|nr:4-phosphoerythronate dehydrogenase [Gammaproteobacteria bacterium]